MGIQDRDYWRERYNQQDRRDYSEKLRDLEKSGKELPPSLSVPKTKSDGGYVGTLLIWAFVFVVVYLLREFARVFF